MASLKLIIVVRFRVIFRDNEREIYLAFRAELVKKTMSELKCTQQAAENHYGKTMTKEAKAHIKAMREEQEANKVDIRDLIGAL